MSLSSITALTPSGVQTDPKVWERQKERQRNTERVRLSAKLSGARDKKKKASACSSMCSSESASVDNAHHHNISDGGDDSNPEPDSITGHGLLLVLLAVYRGGWGSSVDAGGGVEERVFSTVVIIGRGVHEGSCHDRDLRKKMKNIMQLLLLENRHNGQNRDMRTENRLRQHLTWLSHNTRFYRLQAARTAKSLSIKSSTGAYKSKGLF